MNKIRTIIVDDEPEAREGLGTLLENDNDIEVVAVCKNGVEAIDAVNDHQIDLMFLDIQMPVINGFEVVRSIPKERLPHIIFVTAYDQYALKAFEVHAMDYILKPFTNQRFRDSLQRAKQFIYQQNIQNEQEKLKALSESLTSGEISNDQLLIPEDKQSSQRLIVKEKGKVIFVPLHEIIWLEAYDYYVKIHVKDQFYLVRESMKWLSENLPSSMFIRIHKSSIINMNQIDRIARLDNGEYSIMLNNTQELKVSRNYKEKIRHLYKF